MSPLIITIVVLIIMIIGFCSGKISLGLCGLFCSVALLVTGVLKPEEAFAGFANANVVIMLSMMVVTAGLMRTKLMEHIIGLVKKVGGGSIHSIILGFGIIVAIMAQFMNAFVAVACMLPFIIGMCDDMNVSRSKVVFPIGCFALAWVFMFPVGMGISQVAQMNGYLEAFKNPMQFGLWTLAWTRIPSALITSLVCVFIMPKFCPEKCTLEVRNDLGKEIAKSLLSPRKEILAYVIAIGSILMMMTSTLHKIPVVTSAAVGAFLMVLFRILSDKEAIASVQWDMIFMFAGILPIATALTNTGANDVIANAIQTALGGTTNPWVINIAFGVTAWVLTQFLSNTAMVAVFMPLALMMCTKFNMSPIGIMGLVYIGSTASFLTPMATPGIPLVMGAGGYDFKDILKAGIVPAVVSIVVGIIWCSLAFPAY